MKKLNKKGFTIVELVIVIAVIAILAAVLIPTVSGLIKTAQTSADVTLVKNINLILATERAFEGKNATMQDALDDAFDGGYDVKKLTPTNSDNLILWDQESDNFVLYANGKYNNCGAEVNVDENALYKLWNIADNTEGSDYSVYYTGTDTEVTVNGVGFDAGNSNVETVNYASDGNAQYVIIRTNGGELVINASEDSVDHYGVANIVDVQAIANASYHEFGKATFIKVDTGRVEVEASAEIGGIYVTSDAASVTNESGANLPTVYKEGEITESEAKEAAANAVPPAGVARIGLTGYATLQDAINAANSGDAVILLDNYSTGYGYVTIPSDKSIVLNLNGHTLSSEGDWTAICNEGTLTINGNGKIDAGWNAVWNNGGSLTVNGGTLEGDYSAIYSDGGNVTINGGSFKATVAQQGNNAAIMVDAAAALVINDGVFISEMEYVRIIDGRNNSTIEINGGSFNGKYSDPCDEWGDIYVGDCEDEDSFVINGGTFNCTVATNNYLIVNGGTFNGQFHTSAISPKAYTLTINGGTFNLATAQIMVSGNGWMSQINDGTFAATQENVYKIMSGSGTATINGGTFAE